MKTKRSYYLCVALAICAFVGYGVAQLASSSKSAQQEKLDQAAILIGDGKPTEARALIATISSNAPEYRVAKFYDALAIHALGDQIGFLKALEKLPKNSTGVPADVAEDIVAREVQSLHFFRKFEELLPKARAFAKNHAGSTRIGSVKECLLAGLFDRGMKKTEEASRLNDAVIFNKRWPEGKGNLEEFLALVASTGITNYQLLPNRNMKQDIWVARLTLGDENALWGEVPASDVAAREQLSFHRVRLFQNLQKNETEKNIKLANEFIEQFPESVHRKRVEYELAEIALIGGERLVKPGRRVGDPTTIPERRTAATRYLDLARELYGRVAEDPKADISDADVQESRLAIVRINYANKDWAALSECVGRLTSEYPAQGKVWLHAKRYHAAGLVRQSKLTEAAKELDEVLAIGFKGNPSFDGPLASVAGWRISVAQQLGDEETARRVARMVENSDCVGSVKRTFLTKYENLLTQPTTVPK